MRTILLLGCGLLSFVARAGQFDDIILDGGCSSENTVVLENGNNLSVLFQDLAIQLRSGVKEDGKQSKKQCHFRVKITFPNDCYLSNLRQVYSGGVIKSMLSSGAFNILFKMGSVAGSPSVIHWAMGSEISPESSQSLFTKTFDNSFPQPKGCRGQLHYGTRVRLEARRQKIEDFFVGGLDSLDAELYQSLDLIPTYRPCIKEKRGGGRGGI